MTEPFQLGPDVVEYVQRVGAQPFAADRAPVTAAPPASRRVLRVDGVGVREKTRDQQPVAGAEPPRVPLEQVLVGMSAHGMPVAYEIDAAPSATTFRVGTWLPGATDAGALDAGATLLTALLRGAYAEVDLVAEPAPPPRAWPAAGVVLGVPTLPPTDPADPALPIQRLVRALSGTTWSMLVLAVPVGDDLLRELRAQALNDLRLAAAAEAASGAPSPLREFYAKVVQARLDGLADGQAAGLWRTAVYLAGDAASYPAVAGAARSVLSGKDAAAEPFRVYDGAQAAKWAAQWALPETPGAQGPTSYRHPYAAQTLLSSRQLSALVHLPDQEVAGFRVREQAPFDVEPSLVRARDVVTVGTVLAGTTATATPYVVEPRALTRHALVAGTTGSGKTNTVVGMLCALAERDVPFLVIEPAKSEYRALLAHQGFGDKVRVFTPGAETVSPFRLNPFEVEPGVSVATHLDLLRAAFGASFGMWTPLPQVLERCLYEVYVDAGWDLRTDRNARLDGDVSDDARRLAFPTLTDLVAKVADVVHRLGYEERVEADLRAALVTRLDSLRLGGKGAMFDTARSIPMDVLLSAPTIVELESLGDDDDKALLMGLLLVRVAEHRRAAGASDELVHVTVVEEAHRLLSRTAPVTSEETADPRGRAVETFVNLLAEVRAYGEGIVVADQVPLRLAPEVLKNTNLKVAHRTVSADDRDALAGAMAMDPRQARALTTFGAGTAAVFNGGDDTPVIVRFADVKDALAGGRPDDAAVAERMAAWRRKAKVEDLMPAAPFCTELCPDATACRAGQTLVTDAYLARTFARVALSTVGEPGALDRMRGDLADAVAARRPPLVDADALLQSYLAHAADAFVRRRGAQSGWTFADTAQLGDLLRAALVSTGRKAATARAAFADAARAHSGASGGGECTGVCTGGRLDCLYRSAARDAVASGRFVGPWIAAEKADTEAGGPAKPQLWEVAQDAAYDLVEFPESDVPDDVRDTVVANARRLALCFTQQMAYGDASRTPRQARRLVAGVVTESGA